MSRRILIDPLNKASSHLFFNSSVVLSFAETQGAFFVGELTHVEKLKAIVPNFKYVAFRANTVIGHFLKSVGILISKCSFKKHKILFVCSDNTFIPLCLILFYPLLFTNSIAFILHNNLSTLTTNKFKRYLHRFVMSLYSAKVYVLSREMKSLYERNISATGSCIFIPHPNYKKLINFNAVDNLLSKDKINVIILGRQAKLMIDFLNMFIFGEFPNIQFTIAYDGRHPQFENQNAVVINRRLTIDEYYTALSLADFSLFALDDSVLNRASGILLDCISLSCPIIVPEVGHYLEYKNFDIGYYYKNYDDLRSIFGDIDRNVKKRVEFEGQFTAALEYSSPENFEKVLMDY